MVQFPLQHSIPFAVAAQLRRTEVVSPLAFDSSEGKLVTSMGLRHQPCSKGKAETQAFLSQHTKRSSQLCPASNFCYMIRTFTVVSCATPDLLQAGVGDDMSLQTNHRIYAGVGRRDNDSIDTWDVAAAGQSDSYSTFT